MLLLNYIVFAQLAALQRVQTNAENEESVCIGAIFRQNDNHLVVAFQYAVQWVRLNVYNKYKDTTLDYKIRFVDSENYYDTTKQLCSLAESGCIAIFGPPEPKLSNHLEHLADQLSLPYFKIHWDAEKDGLSIDLSAQHHLINALIDVVLHFKMEHLIIVYKDSTKIIRLKRFLQSRKLSNVRIDLIKIDGLDFLDAARRLQNSEACGPSSHLCVVGSRRVLLDLDSVDVHSFLLAALQFGLVNSKHIYIFTSTDIRELDLSLFSHNQVRMIGFDLLNKSGELTDRQEDFLAHVRSHWKDSHKTATYFPMTEAILIFDAVYAFALTHVKMLHRGGINRRVQCSSHMGTPMVSHNAGTTFYNSINTMNAWGLSGSIMFSAGKRRNLSFTVWQMDYDGELDPIGSWTSFTRNQSSKVTINSTDLNMMNANNKLSVSSTVKPHLIVTTIEEAPYIMVKKQQFGLSGNQKFEGFCIDLLNKLTEKLALTYSIRLVKDGRYGNEINGTWDGMIGEILTGEADLAVAPLTVNFKRAQVVDFTKPFLSLGISILYRIPGEQQPSLFSFMNPLSMDIWLYILVALICVTGSMFVVARITPYEWNPVRSSCYFGGVSHHSKYMLDPACPAPPPPPPVELHNQYSFRNTVWYVISTLMKGGCDIGPRAVSSRLLGGIWWVFTLVIVSAYTANLAAVLTVDRRFIPIKSMEDLANQTTISYGAVSGGSTIQFFKESQIETHKRMWAYMAPRLPEVTVSGSKEGVKQVMTKDYAFLMESTSLEFQVVQNCNLTQVGGVLGSKGYGIALRKRSPWTDKISREILNFGERGEIELIKSKWWKKSAANCAGSAAAMKQTRVALNMQNVSGLFVILLAGITLGVFSVVVEFFVKTRQHAVADRQSLCSKMAEELCFAIRLNHSTKKHNMARRCSECETSPVNPPYVPGTEVPRNPNNHSAHHVPHNPNNSSHPRLRHHDVSVMRDLYGKNGQLQQRSWSPTIGESST